MSNKTVAIDISDERAALILLEGAGKKLAVTASALVPAAPQMSPDELAQTVAETLRRENMQADDYVLLLDSGTGIFRSFFFPFSGRAQVQQGLDYELSEELPLPLEEMVYDFSHTRSGKKFSRACAAAYKRDWFVQLLYAFEAQGISPSRIEPEVQAAARAALWGAKNAPATALLIDMGRSRTSITALQRDLPASIQVIAASMRTVCGALDNADDAERQLVFADYSSRDSLSEPQRRLAKALDTYCAEISMALDRYFEQAGEWDGPVFICGEMCCIRGLKELLSEALERDVISIVERAQVRAVIGTDDLLHANQFVAAFGGALPPAEPVRAINFRKGEFAPPQKAAPLASRVRYYAFLLFLCLLTAGAMGGASLYRKAQLLKTYQQAADTLFIQALPDVEASLAPSQKLSILQSRIDRLSRANSGKDGEGMLMLDEFLILTNAVAKNVDVEFDRLSRDSRRTSISGTAKSYELVETVRNGIASAKTYQSVEIKGAAAENKSGRVRFEIVLGRK